MKTLKKTVLAAIFSALTLQVHALTVDVDAAVNSSSGGVGASTGVMLNAGDWFCISVNPLDLWNAGPLPRWSNADGLIVDLYATGTDESGYAAGTLIGSVFPLWTQANLTAPYGALVGQIGTGDFFLIGTSFSGQAANSGQLFLYYWDSNNYDNTEKVTVSADIQCGRVPEGGITAVLLAMGMFVIGSLRKLAK